MHFCISSERSEKSLYTFVISLWSDSLLSVYYLHGQRPDKLTLLLSSWSQTWENAAYINSPHFQKAEKSPYNFSYLHGQKQEILQFNLMIRAEKSLYIFSYLLVRNMRYYSSILMIIELKNHCISLVTSQSETGDITVQSYDQSWKITVYL